jgi:drug/metabolite transporter (DMT)-like permease
MPEERALRPPSGVPPGEGSVPLAVHVVLIFVQVSFGLMHVVAKGVLTELEPLQLAALRVLLATPLLLVIAWRHDGILPPRRELPMLALLGLLGVFLNQVLFIFGLDRTTATNAAILMTSVPVFAIGVAALLRIERIGRATVVGVSLTVAGCLALLDPTRFSSAGDSAPGNLLILLNALCYATFLVVQRPILRRLPWRTVIAWSFLFGTLGVAAVGGPGLARLEPTTISGGTWLGLAFIVLVPTVLGYALATWAVRRSSPSLVAAYITLQPVVAAATAVAFLGESVGPAEIAGFVLITAGLWVVGRRR